jgi:Kdo2-lipid IVA lauroyltransferase/acyltransferase
VSEPAAPTRRRRTRSRARDRAELGLFRLAVGAVSILPRRAREGFARRLALLGARAGASRRRILLDNLAVAFPSKSSADIARIARESLESLGEAFVDFLEVSAMSEEDIRSRIRVVGEENLRQARSRGKGVFLLSAHFGGWELGAIRAGLLGEPIAPVVRPLDNLRALRRGETVAILVDQNVLAREAVFVPFFGRLAATTPALALFQLKTDASVVPVFTWPEGGGKYRLEFEKPIEAGEFRDGAEREAAVRNATARYTEVTEAAIRKAPEAWLWVHNRWRTRPVGETGVGRRDTEDEDKGGTVRNHS